ncbi:MAG: hypothetical protein BMS9Abin15_0369 [Gammaproteobacteria bacterium]|nr:MAG: hypothetical protein BMS9Abin15_0369 [Gammaproteobacteria bacterium]
MDILEFFKDADFVEDIASGAKIFEEGQEGDTMYVIMEGEVDLLINGQSIDSAGPGGMIGEMALIDSSLRSATAIAKTACRVVPLDESGFIFMVQENPLFSIHVMRVLADRLRRMNTRI